MKKSFAVYWGVVALLSLLLIFHNYTAEYFHHFDLTMVNQNSVRLNHAIKVKDQQLKALKDEYLTLRNFVAAKQPELQLDLRADDEKSYVSRSLASQYSAGSQIQIGKSAADSLLENGKVMFRQKFYSKAADYFNEVVDRHSSSPQIVEAYFLQAEAYYQMKDFKASITAIEKMLQLFPESDLTGFILLRMGQIYESKDQKLEALSIYRTVKMTFQNKELVRQATLRIHSAFRSNSAKDVLVSREETHRVEPEFFKKEEHQAKDKNFELIQKKGR